MQSTEPDSHVVFPLVVEDGWPPVVSERVWAFALGDNRYRVDSVPWYVADLAVNDIVLAQRDSSRADPTFIRVLDRSNHLTIRVISFPDGPLKGALEPVKAAFEPLGVSMEGDQQVCLMALDVPPEVDLQRLKHLLTDGEQKGHWAWDEGRINDAWMAL